MSVTDEVKIKEKVSDFKSEFEKALSQATRELAETTKSLAVATDNENNIYYAGTANILDWVEFEDIEVTRFVLNLFDQYPMLQEILGSVSGGDVLHVVFGDELEYELLSNTGFVFGKYFNHEGESGVIGVLGPARMNFPMVMPYVRYAGAVLSEALNSW